MDTNVCVYCGKSFRSVQGLATHRNMHARKGDDIIANGVASGTERFEEGEVTQVEEDVRRQGQNQILMEKKKVKLFMCATNIELIKICLGGGFI